MTAPKPCTAPRCPHDATRAGRCATHANANDKARRGTSTQRGYDRKWRTTAAKHKADNPACDCDGCPSCTHPPGTQAGPCISARLQTHHLDDLGPRGPRGHDPDNLQTLCLECHWRETFGTTGHDPETTHRVTVITGPPCAGKNTYVAQRQQPHHLTVDYDALMAALTGLPLHRHNHDAHPYVSEARDAVVRRLRNRRPTDPPLTAWVITTQASPAQLNRWAPWPVIAIPTPATTCHDRANEQRPESWHEGIERWWNDWEPDANGEHVQLASE